MDFSFVISYSQERFNTMSFRELSRNLAACKTMEYITYAVRCHTDPNIPFPEEKSLVLDISHYLLRDFPQKIF